MNYLLDTCVLSDPTRPAPDAKVKRWYSAVAESRLHISVLSIGELRKGVAKLPDSARARAIADWVDSDLLSRFDGRVLDIDVKVCNRWGKLCGELARHGRSRPVIDSLIAATALEHDLAVVTRNVADFRDFGIDVVNPWQ
jgi:predicted nucleic acid-binding protein